MKTLSKKKLIIGMAVIILIIGATAGGLFLTKDEPAPQQQPETQLTDDDVRREEHIENSTIRYTEYEQLSEEELNKQIQESEQ